MSECSCVYVGLSQCDEIEVIKERLRHDSKRSYHCCECGGVIEAGTIHEYMFGRYDGDICRYRTCMDCLSLRKTFFCDGWIYGNTWELFGEHVDNMDGRIEESCIAALTPAARAKVCGMIEDWWERYDNGEGEP